MMVLTRRARADRKQISAIARTISQCFSHDTLIQWLRPGCKPWNRDGVEQAWQQRRVQRAIFEGQVFCSDMTEKVNASSLTQKGAYTSIHDLSLKGNSGEVDAGVAVMLYPPKGRQKYSWRKLWQGLKIWVLDRISPIPDDGSRFEVRCLVEAHDDNR
jgi:hypothetical protein